MCGLQDRQRAFAGNRTTSFIGISDENTECALPETGRDQRGFPETSRWFLDNLPKLLPHPNSTNQSVRKREDCVSGRNLSHEVVEGIRDVVRLSLGRPQVPTAYFEAVGLI